ncbi:MULTISPECIES: cation-translocating P-type ATPase [Microbacterium]|jgi:cation-transporting ATPase G|uniref:heavy metal translocating P-type ATPase n=1 Tax=Microbacterium TaxID=33882 RepID=UPI000A44255D|nr:MULTISPECIES: cation-translocating P-type ATPase [Microbacterium]MCT1394420.1 cadmium-translocating P-type ATPase [Microbacterium sp. p3-SID338]MDH5131989.1 cation-translocating P-type ATPase [Microbacterium sp. RD10]MDH5135748.1 cation-translocating P-type ATPase [Microbacterium sp. RD11]MDH5144003.1 cation-translocating P-type ATPase [Microbacterium sp. RD12]MDH5154035.1 cation-translocating P-type ATPase [Microbacterium sp. RD06]
MSAECCGDDEPRKTGTIHRVELSLPQGGDGCCGPEVVQAAAGVSAHDDGDACCGPALPPAAGADHEFEVRPPWWRDIALLPSALSGVFLLAGYAFEWTGLEIAALVLQWAALLAGAYTFVPGAIRRVIRGRLGVGLLMTIAAVGAVLLGHVGEAATLAFLFSLAEALEDRAMDRAKEGLRALLSLIPETVRVSRLSGDITVPAADVRELDILVVGAGERVATDGVVVEGRSSLDTSAITGESIPVEVGPGDVVAAGSVNGSATLRIEATADGRDNSLTQIVSLVEQAHARKGDRARLADRIARPLVPVVLIAAALVALFGFVVGDPWTWIERALVVLVAASPCALAIAVPVTVISAIGSASKFGVVIKSGEAFEQLGTIRAVALDKTGTLTRNEPAVVDVRPADGTNRDDLLAWAAAIEATSTHPLAAAITAASPKALSAIDVVEEAGHGIAGRVDGTLIRVGNARWLDPAVLSTAAEGMAAEGMTVVVVEADGAVAGLIGIRDELRPESAETVRMLHSQGIETVMLTGDNERTARAIAAQAGIDDVRAEQLPADKAHAIESLTTVRPTAMVGDGINDAPALATATVGIAMGLKGSAAAIESADVAFTGHDLRLIPGALAHARRGRRIMTANIALALAIIIVLFPLALFGVLGLAGVVLVHEIAEVVVILNGVRAARRPAALRELAPAPEPARA